MKVLQMYTVRMALTTDVITVWRVIPFVIDRCQWTPYSSTSDQDVPAMRNPVHPGAIVREDCLKPLGLSVTEGARRLGIGRQTLSNLVNEKASVSIEMAYRLSKAFGSTPETWLGMQLAFDLARSRHLESAIKIERIAAA